LSPQLSLPWRRWCLLFCCRCYSGNGGAVQDAILKYQFGRVGGVDAVGRHNGGNNICGCVCVCCETGWRVPRSLFYDGDGDECENGDNSANEDRGIAIEHGKPASIVTRVWYPSGTFAEALDTASLAANAIVSTLTGATSAPFVFLWLPLPLPREDRVKLTSSFLLLYRKK